MSKLRWTCPYAPRSSRRRACSHSQRRRSGRHRSTRRRCSRLRSRNSGCRDRSTRREARLRSAIASGSSYDKGSLEVEIVASERNRRIEFLVLEQTGLEKRGALLLGGSMTLTRNGRRNGGPVAHALPTVDDSAVAVPNARNGLSRRPPRTGCWTGSKHASADAVITRRWQTYQIGVVVPF